jgi:flagellar hook-associated protein 2
MSESELRDWDERARTGMLHRDPTIERIMRDMRQAIMGPFEFTDAEGQTRRMTIASFGITIPQGSVGNGGLLQVDQQRLRTALENDPEAATAFFTNSGTGENEGIGDRLEGVWRRSAFGGNSLIARQAGVEGDVTSERNSRLHQQLNRQNDRIARMLSSLQRREEQLFLMFSRMEIAVMQADSQMSQLMGMLGMQM